MPTSNIAHSISTCAYCQKPIMPGDEQAFVRNHKTGEIRPFHNACCDAAGINSPDTEHAEPVPIGTPAVVCHACERPFQPGDKYVVAVTEDKKSCYHLHQACAEVWKLSASDMARN